MKIKRRLRIHSKVFDSNENHTVTFGGYESKDSVSVTIEVKNTVDFHDLDPKKIYKLVIKSID